MDIIKSYYKLAKIKSIRKTQHPPVFKTSDVKIQMTLNELDLEYNAITGSYEMPISGKHDRPRQILMTPLEDYDLI